jgi:uncharacterized protein RhaS with RHS repeats
VGYEDQVNLYAYVGNDPVNSTDPTGTLCIKGINYSSSMCARSLRYEQIDADKQVSNKTRFFGAAAIVTSALAVPAPDDFMRGLSADLEKRNMTRADQIRDGTLDTSGSVRDNDYAFVRFEQTFVQEALNGLRTSDPDQYASVIAGANKLLNNDPVGALGRASDPNFAKGLAAAREALGGTIDFANQEHRETLGRAITDVAREARSVCTSTGTRIARRC